MKFIYLLLIVTFFSSCQKTKVEYLTDNRFDLNEPSFRFLSEESKVIGFGAYHGSAKTEEVELSLLSSLIRDSNLKFYIIEADFSTGYYFNEYLKNGNQELLKELVKSYGVMVPQDRSIETFNKWKRLKKINDTLPQGKKIKVLGIDLIADYKNTTNHLFDLIDTTKVKSKSLKKLAKAVAENTTNYYALGDNESYLKNILKEVVQDIATNKTKYTNTSQDEEDLQHIITNLRVTFDKEREGREPTLFKNYITLGKRYEFNKNLQLVRLGFYHLEKAREGASSNPSFFTRLIENNIYTKEQVTSILGYLTESRVNWEEVYENGTYKTFVTEGGFGIGDYEKEYFRGIEHLKKASLSDKTLFKLNSKNTLYSNGEPDLIDVIMKDNPSNSEAVKGMSTTDFIDFAVLIANSKASTPIFEMD